METAPSRMPGTVVCRARPAWGGHAQAAEPRGQQPVLLLCPWDLTCHLYSPHPGVPETNGRAQRGSVWGTGCPANEVHRGLAGCTPDRGFPPWTRLCLSTSTADPGAAPTADSGAAPSTDLGEAPTTDPGAAPTSDPGVDPHCRPQGGLHPQTPGWPQPRSHSHVSLFPGQFQNSADGVY